MKLARVVIERIPTHRQKAAMPEATPDERVDGQTPVSAWVGVLEAIQLSAYLHTHHPVMFDEDMSMLRYSVQECYWPDNSVPPPPVAFDAKTVRRLNKSSLAVCGMRGPAFGLADWEVIRDALNAVKGDGRKAAHRVVRSVRGHVANLKKREEDEAKRREAIK